ncbi:MAG: 50S ribosomal protein L22 [Candidatus Nealsonbacteria bacterium CG_4_10_14_0_2_um_filter_37_10]|uniref:Large ribosomal subunit protein uL22 n=1 Tax=Candidatus Nealsonbacteria bacterium CG_4_10_14_0_2_um_filter_37_10 TaxID=1974679 RepID=A0A2M7UZF9_9BACT|nr:MAG: 50S ribosomal protein L22 [Candidatus Nealsonbacteria bacterium CG_4_10_14_0_2_um_filter_37_10]
MSVTAKLRYLRIAPRKVRLVADLIRKKSVEEAQTILSFTTKKAAKVLLKLLKQAIANAKTNFQLEEKNLYISKILVDEGPKYKRWMPRARGQASPIQKKTSHVTIELTEIEKKPRKIKKIKKAEKVEKIERVEKVPKVEKPKLRPEIEEAKPKVERGIRRIFRRKAF